MVTGLAPRTLFGRVTLTIAVVSVAFQSFTLTVVLSYALVPLGRSATADLAALMVDSARQWAQRPPSERAGFERQLERDHRLFVSAAGPAFPAYQKLLPYYYFLESELARRTGEGLTLGGSTDSAGLPWIWADLPAAGERVRIGIPSDRAGIHPPLALLLIITVGALVTLITAAALARWLTQPLARLSRAAATLGAGERPERLPEHGPQELTGLAQSFNRMVAQVQTLLDDRTVLLSGISHDLRTPLARIELAVALACREADPALRAGIERDIATINQLIGQYLEIGRGLAARKREHTDVCALLAELVADAGRAGHPIEARIGAACRRELDPLALRRIVANLLDNALRYGAGRPVTVRCRGEAGEVTIQVADHGPGIPPEEVETLFRPFHQSDRLRSGATGGSGLGLAVAQQLARTNGWKLGLSPSEGGGTVAELVIPASRAEPESAATPVAPG